MVWDTIIGCMISHCHEVRIWYFEVVVKLYLYMVVIGIAIHANMAYRCLRQIVRSGKINLNQI